MKFYSPKHKQSNLGLFRFSFDGLDKSDYDIFKEHEISESKQSDLLLKIWLLLLKAGMIGESIDLCEIMELQDTLRQHKLCCLKVF